MLPDLGSILWMRIRETGAAEFLLLLHGGTPDDLLERTRALADPPVRIGWDAFNLARIQAGTAWFDLDGDEARLVPEVLPPDRVSYAKGCYLGQETLARLHHQGQLNWRLHRIRVAAEQPPAEAADIVLADGAKAGWVTSQAADPAGGVLALAFLHRRVPCGSEGLRLASGETISCLGRADGPPIENA